MSQRNSSGDVLGVRLTERPADISMPPRLHHIRGLRPRSLPRCTRRVRERHSVGRKSDRRVLVWRLLMGHHFANVLRAHRSLGQRLCVYSSPSCASCYQKDKIEIGDVCCNSGCLEKYPSKKGIVQPSQICWVSSTKLTSRRYGRHNAHQRLAIGN